jgi:hypothetical protein
MVTGGRHPKKEVAEALKRAEDAGLVVREIHRGHRWGEVRCEPCEAKRAVYSTPRSPGTHAKQLDRFTAQHHHSNAAQPPPEGGGEGDAEDAGSGVHAGT